MQSTTPYPAGSGHYNWGGWSSLIDRTINGVAFGAPAAYQFHKGIDAVFSPTADFMYFQYRNDEGDPPDFPTDDSSYDAEAEINAWLWEKGDYTYGNPG